MLLNNAFTLKVLFMVADDVTGCAVLLSFTDNPRWSCRRCNISRMDGISLCDGRDLSAEGMDEVEAEAADGEDDFIGEEYAFFSIVPATSVTGACSADKS